MKTRWRIAGERDLSYVDKVRFAESGEDWPPVEASGGRDNIFVGGRSCSMRFQVKVTKFVLNPDHAAWRSFVPDDIRKGSRARMAPNVRGGLINCQWQEVRIVDSEGEVAFDSGLKN